MTATLVLTLVQMSQSQKMIQSSDSSKAASRADVTRVQGQLTLQSLCVIDTLESRSRDLGRGAFCSLNENGCLPQWTGTAGLPSSRTMVLGHAGHPEVGRQPIQMLGEKQHRTRTLEKKGSCFLLARL